MLSTSLSYLAGSTWPVHWLHVLEQRSLTPLQCRRRSSGRRGRVACPQACWFLVGNEGMETKMGTTGLFGILLRLPQGYIPPFPTNSRQVNSEPINTLLAANSAHWLGHWLHVQYVSKLWLLKQKLNALHKQASE